MNFRTYRDLLAQRPFKPFRLVTSSGQDYEIRRPDRVLLTQKDMLVGVGETKEGVAAEVRICALESIADIQPLNADGSGPNK
jgi:hypothetical protein